MVASLCEHNLKANIYVYKPSETNNYFSDTRIYIKNH